MSGAKLHTPYVCQRQQHGDHRTTGGGAVVNSGTLGTAESTPLGGDPTSTLVIDLGENNTDMFDVAGAATLSGIL